MNTLFLGRGLIEKKLTASKVAAPCIVGIKHGQGRDIMANAAGRSDNRPVQTADVIADQIADSYSMLTVTDGEGDGALL